MSKGRKKRFIDPKRSVTFEVVPRNQLDPLAVDDSAPKNVLVEKKSRRVLATEDDQEKKDKDSRLDEQRKYGIYFDDDYNYLQHLKDVKSIGQIEEIANVDKNGRQVKSERLTECHGNESAPTILLPSSLFESHVEERVGHLNKNINQSSVCLNWDPDIVAALDSDYDDSEELEDDFVALASGGSGHIEDLGAGDKELNARRFYFTDNIPVDEMVNAGSDNDTEISWVHDKSEIQSKFTNYSLTSSTMTRTGGLKVLDEHFEQMFDNEYNDKEIGSLDDNDLTGHIPLKSNTIRRLTEIYEHRVSGGELYNCNDEPENVPNAKSRISASQHNHAFEKINLFENVSGVDQVPQCDCESILSSYSTHNNRPKIIDFDAKKCKSGVINKKLSKSNILTELPPKVFDYDIKVTKAADQVRPREETAQCFVGSKHELSSERKTRKQQIKDMRRARRMEKKNNSIAFKAEACLQKIQEMSLRNNHGHALQ